jgi:hypothetical protein
LLAQTGDFAYLLEVDDLARLVAVDREAGRVVAAVLFTRKCAAEDVEDLRPALYITPSQPPKKNTRNRHEEWTSSTTITTSTTASALSPEPNCQLTFSLK